MRESTSCTSQTKSHILKLEGDRVTSGWPPEPSATTATEPAVPSTRASPCLPWSKTEAVGNALNHAPLRWSGLQAPAPPTACPGGLSLCTFSTSWRGGPSPATPVAGVCAHTHVGGCVCSCVCARSHTLTRACARSPVLRKSKIAVSLNSFLLAARTAFVLQTKRKRNETEGSEEAGEGGREGARGQGAN